MTDGPNMMAKEEIAGSLLSLVGSPVRMTVLDAGTGERRFRLHGVMVRVAGPHIQVDLVDQSHGLAPGTTVAVEVLVSQQLFWFHTTTFDPGSETARNRLWVNLPEDVEITQRRRYPRLDLEVPVHLVVQATGKVTPARLRDLSAGGASAWVDEPVPPGGEVSLICSLGSGMYFSDLKAEPLRCSAMPDESWLVALRFQCTPEQENALVTWVNERLSAMSN